MHSHRPFLYNLYGKRKSYLPLFDALRGLSFWTTSLTSLLTCEAVGHIPKIHFTDGSGYTLQYFPVESSTILLHPSQVSTMMWQLPPVYPQPFLDMNVHSEPSLTVWQITMMPPFGYWSYLLFQTNCESGMLFKGAFANKKIVYCQGKFILWKLLNISKINIFLEKWYNC